MTTRKVEYGSRARRKASILIEVKGDPLWKGVLEDDAKPWWKGFDDSPFGRGW